MGLHATMKLDGHQVHVDSWHDGIYQMQVNGKEMYFEWSDRFGPLVVQKDGSEMRQPGQKHSFWPAMQAWFDQGKRVCSNCNRCIWRTEHGDIFNYILPTVAVYATKAKVLQTDRCCVSWGKIPSTPAEER